MGNVFQKKRGGLADAPCLSDNLSPHASGPPHASVVLWGVGNPLGGDDGVGVRLAEALGAAPPKGMKVVNCETVPENYLAPLRRHLPELLLVVDAADMGLSPGSVRRLRTQDLTAVSWGTHGTFLPQLLAPLDLEVVFLGIQPLVRALGTALTPPVAAAASHLESLLRRGNWDLIPWLYQEKRSPR